MPTSRSYPRHLVQFCEKKKKKESILPPCNVAWVPKGSQGILRVTNGYQWLPMVTRGYQRLPQVTTGYHGLPQVITGYLPGYPPGYPPSYPPGYLPGYLMLPNLTNHFIKLSKCQPMVRMKFGHFFVDFFPLCSHQ